MRKNKTNIIPKKCDNLEEFKNLLNSDKEYYIIIEYFKFIIYEKENQNEDNKENQ